MGSAPQVRPLTVEEAKAQLLRDDPHTQGPAGLLRDWALKNPTPLAATAAGVGLAMVLFPRLRRTAVATATLAFRGWLLWGRLKPPA